MYSIIWSSDLCWSFCFSYECRNPPHPIPCLPKLLWANLWNFLLVAFWLFSPPLLIISLSFSGRLGLQFVWRKFDGRLGWWKNFVSGPQILLPSSPSHLGASSFSGGYTLLTPFCCIPGFPDRKQNSHFITAMPRCWKVLREAPLQFCLPGGTGGITCQCNALYSHWQNKLPPWCLRTQWGTRSCSSHSR